MASKEVQLPAHQEKKIRILPKKENHISVYSNSVNIGMSNWDMRFDFGEMEPTSEKELIIQPKVTVVMSPQHAKAFLGVLTKNVANYQRDFGEIRFEPFETAVSDKP